MKETVKVSFRDYLEPLGKKSHAKQEVDSPEVVEKQEEEKEPKKARERFFD